MPNPGQILRPAPNGIILIPVTPVISASSPPVKNLSGSNSFGLVHSFGSSAIAGRKNSTLVPVGISNPPNFTGSVTEWVREK
uniref:Uncharacterized protein n=1 Tax=Helianthus annuus TaxID=4232 RepID=A0A251SLB7_HELAN